MIPPHGGKLSDCFVSGAERNDLLAAADAMPRLRLNARELCDLEMIATGAMSPLTGFMGSEDYRSVVESARLANGLAFGVPVVLAAKGDEAPFEEGKPLALIGPDETVMAVLELEAAFEPDKDYEAQHVLRTTDEAHPGVQYLASIGDAYLGGRLRVLNRPKHSELNEYRLDPKETRVLFRVRGWQRIAAFQTRNPIHRAHEYLQKCALEMVDGLLIHPLVGETKADDIPAEVRMRCYQALLENYYPSDRVVLSVMPAAMRYAGPREAILHALIRQNYGCTHFIVGRDHAGVGSYYGTYDAHYVFDEFKAEELGITPLRFDHAFYCRRCGNMASTKTCPHGKDDHVFLSGTQVREMLGRGELPPVEFTRPEVGEVLLESAQGGPEGSR